MKRISILIIAFFACVFFFTQCKKEEVAVTFHPNGGKGAVATQYFSPKEAQPLMANPFSNRGHAFNGWCTAPDGLGVVYKDQETITIKSSMVLYAQWRVASGEFTVTFDANGGKGEMEPQKFEAGDPKPLDPNAFVREDYLFTGWNTAPNGDGKSFENQQIVDISSNITLYAQWYAKYNTYFVIFDANGGVGTMEKQTFLPNQYQKLDSNIFTNNDFFFKGWNTKKDGSGGFYRDGQEITINANWILYAQWINPNGGGEPCPGTPNVTDVDGNTYGTVQIGAQCWMRENLRTTKLSTNINIPNITDDNEWSYANNAAMCYYNNETTNAERYGAIYNGYAVRTNKLCPDGWHVPSETDWDDLAGELGGNNIAGDKMKTTFDWFYYGYDGGGSNESGFSAFPAGYRYSYSEFYGMGYLTFFWSSTSNYDKLNTIFLKADGDNLNNSSNYFGYGCSVRCIKN